MRFKLIHWAGMLALCETMMYFIFRPALISPDTHYREYVALLKMLLVVIPIFVTVVMVMFDLLETDLSKRRAAWKEAQNAVEARALKVVKCDDGRVVVYLKDRVQIYVDDYNNYVTVSYKNAKTILDTAQSLGVQV